MISFQYKNVKPLNKYYPATIGMIFSPKFVFDAKIQRSCFLKYTKYSVALNINFKSKLIFSNTKMYKMYIPRGLGRVKNNKMFCFRQCWTKYYGKTMYNKFFQGVVYRWFFPIFLRNCQNLSFAWLVGCLPSIPSISEIFLKLSNCY